MELCPQLTSYFKTLANVGGLLLGDLTENGQLELVIGTVDGSLAIMPLSFNSDCYKFPSVLAAYGDLGQITALCYGDIFNNRSNVIVVINSEGSLSCLRLKPLPTNKFELDSCFSQPLPANICFAHITDIEEDGDFELLVALTDRIVRTYRFVPVSEQSNISNNSYMDGHLLPLNKWEVPAQITSIALSKSNQLYLSQPTFNYVHLDLAVDVETDEHGQEMPEKTAQFIVPRWADSEQISTAVNSGFTYCFLPKHTTTVGFLYTLMSHVVLISENDKILDIPHNYQVCWIQPIQFTATKLLIMSDWSGLVFIFDNDGHKRAHLKITNNVITIRAKVMEIELILLLVVATVSDEIFMYKVPLERLSNK